MNIVVTALILFVAVLHCYFLVLEMFLWTKKQGLKTFRMTKEKAEMTSDLAANQGLYNGFLAAGLFWSRLATSPEVGYQTAIFFLGCVVLAGIYGGYSVNRRIFFVQSIPAILAMICLLI